LNEGGEGKGDEMGRKGWWDGRVEWDERVRGEGKGKGWG